MLVPLAGSGWGCQGAKWAALLFAAGIVPWDLCPAHGRRSGQGGRDGRVLPNLPREGGSKTPFSPVSPPSGTRSTSSVLSGGRHQQCRFSGTQQAARGKWVGDEAGKICPALFVQVHAFKPYKLERLGFPCVYMNVNEASASWKHKYFWHKEIYLLPLAFLLCSLSSMREFCLSQVPCSVSSARLFLFRREAQGTTSKIWFHSSHSLSPPGNL